MSAFVLLCQASLQADGIGDESLLERTVVSGPLAPRDYWLFEAGPVRPLAISHDGTRLYVANIPDGSLEVFAITGLGLQLLGSVPVGMAPVALAVSPDDQQVWVVNHLSDSISVVDMSENPPRLQKTLWVGDEPRDIVFAGPDRSRVFVTTAHRGQNSPVDPQLTLGGTGRADIWVFDSNDTGSTPGGTPLTIVTLFGDTPRALATSPDGSRVYAAIFRSGNQTTTMWPAALEDFPKPPPNDSADGVEEPDTGVILKWVSGRWTDEIGRNYNSLVTLNLPDLDVFEINAMADVPVELSSIASVGTTLFNMAVNPVSGALYVSNIEAMNHVRFAGDSNRASTSVRGHLADHRITYIKDGEVKPRHLNKHLDSVANNGTGQDRETSLSMPMDMVISSDGQTMYVAAYGSSKVAVYPVTDIETDTHTSDPARHIEISGGGPAGLALDEQHRRLYVLSRFDNSVSIIDLDQQQEVDRVSLFSPEPESVKRGRKFLYDARLTSGFGNDSCAVCHLFGDNDALAWDLGDPDGVVKPIPNAYEPITANHPDLGFTFHPLKGPMTTQSMRGLPRHGPQHWRGDRTGTQPRNGETLEEAAFKEFNEAFSVLAAKQDPLSDADMQAFSDFSMQLTYPPNPIRSLDNTLTESQLLGQALYMNGVNRSDGILEICVTCHTLDPENGIFGTTGLMAFNNQPGEKDFKIPHFRDQYQKVGMFTSRRVASDQVRGFGMNHNGATSINALFTEFGISRDQTNAIKNYLFAYPSETAPVMGQQLSVSKSSSEMAFARFDLILQRAKITQPFPECDLVVETRSGAFQRSWYYERQSSRFVPDLSSQDALDEPGMKNLVLASDEPFTLTCTPWGSGRRTGIDRDGDTVPDFEEIQQGSDPALADSAEFKATPGLWYNPARAGSGFDLQHLDKYMAMTWYTYDEQGNPTWYQAVAEAGPTWTADLRKMQWNPDTGTAVENSVGQVSLEFSDSRNAMLAWQIGGQTGNEPIGKQRFANQPTALPFTGLWYDSNEPGYGLSIDTQGDTRAIVIYFYDDENQPRWVLILQDNKLSANGDAISLTGPCPWCDFVIADETSGGSMSMDFLSNIESHSDIDVYLGEQNNGRWNRQNVNLTRLTTPPNHVPFH